MTPAERARAPGTPSHLSKTHARVSEAVAARYRKIVEIGVEVTGSGDITVLIDDARL